MVSSSYTDEHFCPVRSLSTFTRKTLVDNSNEPLEQACIQELRDRISDYGRLSTIQRGCNLLRSSSDLFLDRPLLELYRRDPKKSRGEQQRRLLISNIRVVPHAGDIDVPEMQESGQESENCPLLVDSDADNRESILSRPKLLRIIDTRDGSRIGSSLP